jgi:hypothetical protein
LVFPTGVERYAISTRPDGRNLLGARLTHPAPQIQVVDGRVELRYPLARAVVRPPGESLVWLNAGLVWSLAVGGNASHLTVDLSGCGFGGADFRREFAHTTLALPAPAGQVTLRMSTADDVVMNRPSHVPVRIEVGGIATQLRLDHRFHAEAQLGLVDEVAGWDEASDRYLVLVKASAHAITIRAADPSNSTGTPPWSRPRSQLP